ncbi:50S ribosomal protein L29 [Candidatus Parcubacteria bacterium]|nr:50S ribosomal protein L29 [Candidatus Parcubacteria bacterium]
MNNFKNKTEKDLKKILADKKKALQDFRFNISGSKTRNVKEGKGLRKEIAQILTELNRAFQ